MVRGRKPIPTAVNKIIGRARSNRMPPNEPTIGIPRVFGLPLAPPTYLDDYAVDEWQRTWESLWDAGIMTHVDVGALAIYCQAHARWRRAEEAIQEIAKEDPKNGGLVLVTTNGNIVQNPLVGIANSSMRDAIRYGAEFGLTPSSRARLGIVATKPYDPNDKYFDWDPFEEEKGSRR